ncbi:MAG: VPLPA-CTERM sorting domain-containing protein [Nitrospira sp.]|nr:VPLPA-CTERM sorting domain-containing protein [Nitrospira sp.]
MNRLVRTMFRTFSGMVFCGLIALNAHASTVYDEAAHGDLSTNNLSPTSVGLGLGENLILGSTVHTPSLDRDFFTLTVDAGQMLNAIVLSSYTTTDDQSFFGMAKGNGITDLTSAAGLLGWALIGDQPGLSVGDNLLDNVAGGPVGPGAYTFWLQETSGSTTYILDYQVAAVPLPAALPLFLSGLVGIGAIARKMKWM